MSPVLGPKQYGPLVLRSGADHALAYRTAAGAAGVAAAKSSGEAMSPSDLMMAALGSCLAVSVRAAARKIGVDPGAIEMTVEAVVAGDLPRRFNRFAVGVAMAGVDDPALAGEILDGAERLCTVSHTLNAEIELAFVPGG